MTTNVKRTAAFVASMMATLLCWGHDFQFPCQNMIEKGEYKEAADKIRSVLQKDKNNVEYNLAMAVVYSQDDYKQHNIEKAYRAAITAKNALEQTSAKQLSKLASKGITSEAIDYFVNSLKDEYFVTLTCNDDKMEERMTKYMKRMKNAPAEHLNAIQGKLDSIATSRKLAAERAQAAEDSLILVEFNKANDEKRIKVMEQMYKTYKCLQDNDNCIIDIHHYYADYGDIYAFKAFYNTYGRTHKALNKPYYADGKSIIEHDDHIMEIIYSDELSDIELYDAFIRASAPSLKALNVLSYLIKQPVADKNWNLARQICETYSTCFGDDKRFASLLNTIIRPANNTVKAHQINIFADDELNSHYSPIVKADNKSLFFCASDIRGNNTCQEEMIYEVKMLPNGQYENMATCITPHSLLQKTIQRSASTSNFTTKFVDGSAKVDTVIKLYNNTAPEAISTTGKEMVFFLNGNIAMMQKTHQGWKTVGGHVKINMSNIWQADISLASNGKAVLYASHLTTDRDIHSSSSQQHEHANIFVSIIDNDGNWSKPIDLGPTINTMGCDRSPFLHPDMKTLYFASDGHGSLGDMDIYMSTRLSDTCWTCWSEPVNIGKEYNTVFNDWRYNITTDGKKAFFSREIDIPAHLRSKANRDTYERMFYVNLTDDIRPDNVATISGKVLDSDGKPVRGEIVWEDLSNGLEMGRSPIDPESGEIFIVLPQGKNYGYYVVGDKVFPLSGNIDLRNMKEFKQICKDFKVYTLQQMIKEGVAMPLNNLFFDKNEATLCYESMSELRRLADLIKRAKCPVEIGGHTDATGDAEFNQELSEKRSQTVREFLISHGCPADNLVAVGYGSSQPIASNKTEAGREKNRRVEMKFIVPTK